MQTFQGYDDGQRPPPIVKKEKFAAQKGGVPKLGVMMPWSSSQVMQVTVVSVELFGALLPANEHLSPEWICWCKLVELVQFLLRPQIWRSELYLASRLDYEHQRLYKQVPQYVGTEIQKDHAMPHLIRCVFLNGCMRYTWNFNNENFLQELKAISKGGNWKDEGKRIATFMSMKQARHLANQQTAAWGGNSQIRYVQKEPTNLIAQVGTDMVLACMVGPTRCLGAWEVHSIAVANKLVSQGAWMLCDDNNGAPSLLVHVQRIIQLQHCKSG